MSSLDRNRRSRNPLSSPPAQPKTSSENITRFSDPTERNTSDDGFLVVFESGGHHLGREGAESEGVDGDLLGGETAGQVSREAGEGEGEGKVSDFGQGRKARRLAVGLTGEELLWRTSRHTSP